MFLVEERRNGQRRAEIYMRPDGLFEGRIYRQTAEQTKDFSPPLRGLCVITALVPTDKSPGYFQRFAA